MKYRLFFIITAIAMALALLTFWVGLAFVLLSACEVIQVELWVALIAWLAVLTVMVIIVVVFYNLTESEETKSKK